MPNAQAPAANAAMRDYWNTVAGPRWVAGQGFRERRNQESLALLLTTTGRKSGEKYVFPLFYGSAGDSYFVIASKGGAPQHPGWYRNILANPEVELQVGTAKMKARARTATGDERARLWESALEFWPPYADYQKKTEREIPVVVLDPVR